MNHCFTILQVPETEDENSPQEYKEFCKLLLDGQAIADNSGRTHIFIWRGYKACVSSQIPKLTTTELKRRYELAMQFIKKKEEEDGENFFVPSQQARKTTSSPVQERVSTSSGSQQSTTSSSSFRATTDSLNSDEPTQIPETQGVYAMTLFN